ncbi:MAG: hypothetical protein JO170_09015 [Verrucomicrobia bacterium]|nr:hypothetical protein [Verrucomicrobiota bacterium]
MPFYVWLYWQLDLSIFAGETAVEIDLGSNRQFEFHERVRAFFMLGSENASFDVMMPAE